MTRIFYYVINIVYARYECVLELRFPNLQSGDAESVTGSELSQESRRLLVCMPGLRNVNYDDSVLLCCCYTMMYLSTWRWTTFTFTIQGPGSSRRLVINAFKSRTMLFFFVIYY